MFIEPQHLEIIKDILKKGEPDYEVWAFGSRVHGEHLKKFSDLDIAIISDKKVPSEIISNLKDSFSDLYLPFKVDVLDWITFKLLSKKIIKSYNL